MVTSDIVHPAVGNLLHMF